MQDWLPEMEHSSGSECGAKDVIKIVVMSAKAILPKEAIGFLLQSQNLLKISDNFTSLREKISKI